MTIDKLKKLVLKKNKNIIPTIDVNVVINPPKPKSSGIDATYIVNEFYINYMKGRI